MIDIVSSLVYTMLVLIPVILSHSGTFFISHTEFLAFVNTLYQSVGSEYIATYPLVPMGDLHFMKCTLHNASCFLS